MLCFKMAAVVFFAGGCIVIQLSPMSFGVAVEALGSGVGCTPTTVDRATCFPARETDPMIPENKKCWVTGGSCVPLYYQPCGGTVWSNAEPGRCNPDSVYDSCIQDASKTNVDIRKYSLSCTNPADCYCRADLIEPEQTDPKEVCNCR